MKIQLCKCSNILKDPYNPNSKNLFYKLYNKIITFKNICDFEFYFVDFNRYTFPGQAKELFDAVGLGVRNENPNFLGNLNKNIYLALREEEKDEFPDNDFLSQYFCKNTSDWKIVSARTLYTDPTSIEDHFAQITMKYTNEQSKENYIIFERPVSSGHSFINWDIFVINYFYYKK